jgi:hypothetical protein
MVAQRIKSLIIEELAKPSDRRAFHVFTVPCRPLLYLNLLCCFFWTQISEAVIRLERSESL